MLAPEQQSLAFGRGKRFVKYRTCLQAETEKRSRQVVNAAAKGASRTEGLECPRAKDESKLENLIFSAAIEPKFSIHPAK